MDIPTSITAPRDAINIPEKSTPPTSNLLFCATYASVSTSSALRPLICPSFPNKYAIPPATKTPATVPNIAHKVLIVQPPINIITTIVIIAVVNVAATKGETPMYSIGIYKPIMQTNVNTSPTAEAKPLLPPTIHKTPKNAAIIIH